MPTLRETLPLSEQLACAVIHHTPIQLARTFAAYEGQFYDRLAFDHLARQVHALYAPADADLLQPGRHSESAPPPGGNLAAWGACH